MNLPNKLTMLRILLIPVFMVVLYWDFPGATWVLLQSIYPVRVQRKHIYANFRTSEPRD